MPQQTIFATLHKRPGALTRTLRHLDHPDVAVVSVARPSYEDGPRLTIAAASRHARAVFLQLAEHPDVTHVTDASLAHRLTRPDEVTSGVDYREQADGAPCEAAA